MKMQKLRELYQSIISQSIPTFGFIKKLTYKLLPQKQTENNGSSFALSIYNPTQNPISFNQSFPCIQIQIAAPILYFLPSNASIYSSNQIKFEANYGGKIQFPFISLRQNNDQFGLMLTFTDPKGRLKQIRFSLKNSSLKISVIYYDLKLESKQTLQLPSFTVVPFYFNENFIFSSIETFKKMPKNPLAQNRSYFNSQFKQNFVLRVIQFFEIQWNIKHKRCSQSLKQQRDLAQMINDDSKLIGPIRFIHLRDWSANGDSIKTKFGNYFKPPLIGPNTDFRKFRDQIRYVQNVLNIGVGLYIQGYLLSKDLFDPQQKQKWSTMELRNENGIPYTIWGSSNFVMCSSCKDWQIHLAAAIQRIYNELQCEAFYIDQYGFGSRTSHYKICSHQLHSHQNFDLQVGQCQTLKHIAQKTNKKPIIYIQQTPNDVTMNHISGSLSSAAKIASRTQQIPLLVDRFINPSFKIYELITQYTMAAQDIQKAGKIVEQNINDIIKGIMVAFWNGNGIYVPKNLKFYDKKVLEAINKLNTTYLYYRDFFTGPSQIPLVHFTQKLGTNQILKNQFRSQNGKEIYTLLNWSLLDLNQQFDGRSIKMPALSLGIYQYDYNCLIRI